MLLHVGYIKASIALKAGRKVTVEVWQWEKNPKANPYLPRKETIIPEQDCQIPFLSLYPCGRLRKETAVLLCNWGLSITGFMHNFRWVMHNFPDLCCCFEFAFALICLALFYWVSRVDKMTGMQCVRCIMISYMSVLAVEIKQSWNLHVALCVWGIWYWLRSICDFDKWRYGNGWKALGFSREAVV